MCGDMCIAYIYSRITINIMSKAKPGSTKFIYKNTKNINYTKIVEKQRGRMTKENDVI